MLTAAADPARANHAALRAIGMISGQTWRRPLQKVVHPVAKQRVDFQVPAQIRVIGGQLIALFVAEDQGTADIRTAANH